MLSPQDFFDLSQAQHAGAFRNCHYVWEAVGSLADYVRAALTTDYLPGIDPAANVHPSAIINTEQVHIGAGAVIAPQCYIEGPAVISAGASVGQGAYIRADVVLSRGALVGHASEAKNALFLENAHAPHFAYVGDSLLGARVNLGAGTKLSNLAMNSAKDPQSGRRPSVMIRVGEQVYDTGLAKLGAILGDDVQCGCNAVTNPGTLIGPRTLVYALAAVRKGYYPPDQILKVSQTQDLTHRH